MVLVWESEWGWVALLLQEVWGVGRSVGSSFVSTVVKKKRGKESQNSSQNFIHNLENYGIGVLNCHPQYI